MDYFLIQVVFVYKIIKKWKSHVETHIMTKLIMRKITLIGNQNYINVKHSMNITNVEFFILRKYGNVYWIMFFIYFYLLINVWRVKVNTFPFVWLNYRNCATRKFCSIRNALGYAEIVKKKIFLEIVLSLKWLNLLECSWKFPWKDSSVGISFSKTIYQFITYRFKYFFKL